MFFSRRRLRLYAIASIQVFVLFISFTPTALAVITDGMNASYVLGQPDFTSNGTTTTQAGMYFPYDVAYDETGKRLFVADGAHHRVLIYDTTSISNGENAVNVLGQINFTSNGPTTSQAGMEYPHSLAYDATNNRLFVADQNNNRVLVYDVTSIVDGENAVNVLGQANFTSAGAATSQSGMNGPSGIVYDTTNNRLFVSDGANRRVLVYDVTSITNGENAINVLGQSNFTSNGTATTQAGLNTPYDVTYDTTGNRLFVADSGNSRVLIFDVTSISDGENAVNVLGQTNFTSNGAATTQAGMNIPTGTSYDSTGNRLFVSEVNNNRVVVYDVTSIIDGENAIHVLGQSNFTSAGTALTQAGENVPYGVTYDSFNNRVFVSDTGNNRVLIFNNAEADSGGSSGGGSSSSDVPFFSPILAPLAAWFCWREARKSGLTHSNT